MAHPKDLQELESYLSSLVLAPEPHQNMVYSYVAIRVGDRYQLLAGQAWINGGGGALEDFSFHSETVVAERLALNSAQLDVEQLCRGLLEQKPYSSFDDVYFRPRDQNSFGIMRYPAGPPQQSQARINTLSIFGGDVPGNIDYSRIEWDLKSSDTPFDGLFEIFEACLLQQPDGQRTEFSVFAHVIVAIDREESRVEGERATIRINTLLGTDTGAIDIGLKVRPPGNQPPQRTTISNQNINWTSTSLRQEGTAQVQVPQNSIVECIARFEGLAQHYYWIADPNASHGVRLTSLLTFDADQKTLVEYLTWKDVRGRNSREFELGVGWLLWLMGLAPLQLDPTGKNPDSPDLLVISPAGEILVVECTVGLLKAENKLAKLIARAQLVRTGLVAKGLNNRVTPVIVSAMPRDQLAGDLAAAGEHGVAVIAKEEIDNLRERCNLPLDAEQAVQLIIQQVPVTRPTDGSS